MNKQDSRFITSEKRIKEAFFGLLSRKSIDEIRTQEIIASAGINKSTFYSHYKDKYDLLKVFIYADDEQRIRRITEEYHEASERPEKDLIANDKRRATYYEIYTDQKFGDYHFYDMCLSSSSLGVENCAKIILEAYQKKTAE